VVLRAKGGHRMAFVNRASLLGSSPTGIDHRDSNSSPARRPRGNEESGLDDYLEALHEEVRLSNHFVKGSSCHKSTSS